MTNREYTLVRLVSVEDNSTPGRIKKTGKIAFLSKSELDRRLSKYCMKVEACSTYYIEDYIWNILMLPS
jgi:hypothetical protein